MSRRRFLLVVGCILCLLAVTIALPAADPRLETPGADEQASGGTWETLIDTDDEESDDEAEEDEESTSPTTEITVQGTVAPGNTVRVGVQERGFWQSGHEVYVDGTSVGVTGGTGIDDSSSIEVTVPFDTEMTVEVPDESLQETVEIPTDAAIEVRGGVAQNSKATVSVVVDDVSISGVGLTQDGDAIGRTDDDGEASIRVPERVGTMTLSAERGPIDVTRDVRIPEPTVRFTSAVMLPGAPAPVRVTADGAGVPDATVSVPGGGTATTDEDGYARVGLPIDNQAKATVEIDGVRSTATVGNLYLRLTIAGVVIPGLVLGLAYTYLTHAGRGAKNASFGGAGGSDRPGLATALFVGLADALASLLDLFRAPSLPRPSVPDLSLGRSGRGWLPSLSGLVSSLPRPSPPRPSSFAAGLLSRSRSVSSGLSLPNPLRSSDDSDHEQAAVSLADEPLGPVEPNAELRTLWHRFLDRLGVERRETSTPGQVARRALAAGFPAAQVRRLLGIFRRVEYGDQEPSPERVDEARDATRHLMDHDSEEGDR
jgi:hypothetical protein